MTHQEFADFLIDVYEAKLYRTNTFFGVKVENDFVGWLLTCSDEYYAYQAIRGKP